ncbi:hypothetical protein N8D56_03675 [Devosia sp. A8/3-2]|nr:hypothetical protein N8D56_03675 [Devosia sp. A8/3-2]
MSDQPIEEPSRPANPHEIIAAETYRRSRGFWRILAFVALAVAILAVAGRFALSNAPVGEHIARVVIDGTIATDPTRLKLIEGLAEDDSVRAVVVAINSPGGTTAGGEELYEALGQLRAKSRSLP